MDALLVAHFVEEELEEPSSSFQKAGVFLLDSTIWLAILALLAPVAQALVLTPGTDTSWEDLEAGDTYCACRSSSTYLSGRCTLAKSLHRSPMDACLPLVLFLKCGC